MVASTKTNESGQYRLFWVDPGKYYVHAGGTNITSGDLAAAGASSISLPQQSFDEQFSPTFYPGVVDSSRAISVVNAQLDFVKGKDRRINGMVLHQGGRDMKAPSK